LERKLTAILCADVYGYSRLMGEDEATTLQTLSACRKIIDGLLEDHRGRFVNSAGDSVLAEFTSVVEAVNCAVGIQVALKTENEALPLNRRMEFRIGVNLGDVMVEGEQIYGDGVNVAARLESLAEPGGICISGTVYEQVRDKLALSYEDRGEQSVKNIARPVHVWRVVAEGTPTSARLAGKNWRCSALSLTGLAIAVGTFVLVQHLSLKPPHTHASIPPPPSPALALPDKPSIAVLPFTNMSGDREQEYFSDGITDDLITDLSRIPKLFVIARTSSFTYKGKAEKAQSIGRELGVKYLLEGSARKAGGQVRIDVHLVDAAGGNEVWSQRYDRKMDDIFKLQDELVQSLSTTISLQLPMLEGASGIFAHVVRQRTDNLEAYDYLLRGLEENQITTLDRLARSREMFEKAISLDPGYADAYAELASALETGYSWQFDSQPKTLDRAEVLARKAVSLDDSNSIAYAVLGKVIALKNRPDEAITTAEHAIALDPNNAVAYGTLADVLGMAGKSPGVRLAYAQKAMRLDPNHPQLYLFEIGWAYLVMQRYQDAAEALKGALPNDPYTHLCLAYLYLKLGREQDARAESAEVFRLAPGFSLAEFRKRIPETYWDSPWGRQFMDDLRRAGLK
jgi:adenylate cyclase